MDYHKLNTIQRLWLQVRIARSLNRSEWTGVYESLSGQEKAIRDAMTPREYSQCVCSLYGNDLFLGSRGG